MKKYFLKFKQCWTSYCKLNLEAKLGIVFLLPPVCGIIAFIFNAGADFDDSDGLGASALPLYCGLMAIAGAYLIKGNLSNNKKDKE